MRYKSKQHGLLAVVAVLILLLTACGSTPGTSSPSGGTVAVEGAGFDTPEEAVLAYLQGMKEGDLHRMMSTFAVETYVEHYDLQAQLERVRAYSPYYEIRVPNVNEFFTTANVERRRATISNAIANQCTLLGYLDVDLSAPSSLKEDEEIQKLMNQMNEKLGAVDFASLEVLGFIPPAAVSELYASEANQNNMAKQADVCGASQIVSYIGAFTLDEVDYFLCMDMVEYDGKWYILQLGGNMAQMLRMALYTQGMGPLSNKYFDFDIEGMVVPIAS